MTDYISRQAAIEAVDECTKLKITDDFYTVYTEDMKDMITDIPAADVRENVRGEWIFDRDGYDFNLPAWRCNKCGAINANIPPEIMTKDSKTDYRPVNPHEFSGSNFCPNCGAKMEVE